MARMQLLLAASLMTSPVFGKDEPPAFVAHPVGPELGRWSLGLGVGIDVLPRRLVEAEWRQLPHALLHSRIGLGRNFYLS